MKAFNQQGYLLQSGPAGGGGGATFLGGFSTMGNTSGNTGIVSSRMVLVGGNNITLSGSTVAGQITITISGGSAGGLTNINVSAGTTSNNLSALTFSNANGVSFGLNASTITAIHDGLTSQSNQNVTADNGGFAFQTLSFSNTHGFTFGTSAGSAIFGSHNGITSQSNQQMTLFATGNTTQSSTGTTNASSVIFRGEGIVSLGITNGSIVVSATTPSQTNQTIGFFAVGNTTQNSSTTLDAQTVSFGGRGEISVGFSNGTIQLSVTQSSQAVSAANGSFAFQQLAFHNTHGVSFSTSTTGVGAQVVFASHDGITSQSNQQLTMFATGNTTQSSTGTSNASSLIFRGEGIASVGITNGSVVVSVPSGGGAGDGGVFAGVSTMGNTAGSTGTVSTGNFVLVGTNGISLSQSTAGAGSAGTVTIDAGILSKWRRGEALSLANTNITNSVASIAPFILDSPVVASNVIFAASISAATQTNTSSAGFVVGWSGVIYTRTGSTLSSINSFSNSTSTFHQSNSTLSVADRRVFTANLASSSLFSMGEYWLALHLSTTTSGQTSLAKGISMAILPGGSGASAFAQANYFGSSITGSRGPILGGPGTFGTAATRASFDFTALTGGIGIANVWFELRNYTIW